MKKINRTFLQMLSRFLKPAFSMHIMSLKGLVPALLGSIVSIITIFLLKEITNNISDGFNDDILDLLYFFIGLVFFHYIILVTTRNWMQVVMRPEFRRYFYKKFIKKYTYLDNNETEKLGTGKLIAMFDKGMFSWVDMLVRSFEEVLPNMIFILFSFIFIFFINVFYFFSVLFVFIFILVLTYIFQGKAKKYRIERRDINIGITRHFVKILMAKFEILQNNKGNKEGNKIAKTLDRNIYLNTKVNNFNIITDVLVKFLIDGSKILIIIMFGIGLGNNVINFGEFVALMSIIYVLDQIFTKSISTYITFTKTFVDVEKVWDFLDSTPEIKGYDKGKKFEYKKGKIEIKNLKYGYDKKKPVFKDFDLKIRGGKVTALVGNSGSGKSTLVKLIAGYIRANKGDILIDDQKLNRVSLKSYYKNIGYLTQDPSVFDGTIVENLTYAINRELKEEELEKVLKQSKCEFIYDLKDGINTEIGERGVRLSGGQKQRLAIAKIFFKNPKIIILDEPTSALDSFSEEQITKAMHNLFKGRTVIIIAHRLQTVKDAAEILVFENGEIKERGTHTELVKLKGQYKKMLDLQSGF